MRIDLSIVVVALGLSAFRAGKHHAFAAEFDINSPVKLRGTLTKMEWVNPHAWLHIEVKDEEGKTVAWMIETAAPTASCGEAGTEELPRQSAWRSSSKVSEPGTGSNRANGATISCLPTVEHCLSEAGPTQVRDEQSETFAACPGRPETRVPCAAASTARKASCTRQVTDATNPGGGQMREIRRRGLDPGDSDSRRPRPSARGRDNHPLG